MGFLTSPSSYFVKAGYVPDWLQNFWPALAMSWVVAAMFGVLLGAPTLRLRGDYLAIVTLGFGEIVLNVFLNADRFTNGTAGINPIGRPTITVAEDGSTPGILHPIHRVADDFTVSFSPTDQANWYWLILAIGVFSLLMIRRFHDSWLGRTWMAFREDEIAAASMGANLVRTKL